MHNNVVPLNDGALTTVAAEVVDCIQSYGSAELRGVTDEQGLRRYVRAEARRRDQRLRTYYQHGVLLVWSEDEHLTVAARQFVAESMRTFGQVRGESPTQIDVAGRV